MSRWVAGGGDLLSLDQAAPGRRKAQDVRALETQPPERHE